jgi:predicted amidohydrolase YtcJ
MGRRLVLAACALAVAGGVAVAAVRGGGDAAPTGPAPQTIVHHGRITTMDARGSVVEALAIRDGVIVDAGPDDRIRALAGAKTRQIDLGGRRVLPGLVDASLRGVQMGSTQCFSRSPRFDGVYTRAEALRIVADRAQRTPAGSWLAATGRGWNPAQFDTPGMLTKAELDAIAPAHPVYLQAAGFRGGQLNSLGLRQLGLAVGDRGVVRAATGAATGQVTGPANARAQRAVGRQLATLGRDERESCTRDLVRELNRRGLTAWDDPGGDDLGAISAVYRAGELGARVRLNFPVGSTAIGDVGDDLLRIGGIGPEVVAPGANGVYPAGRYRRILTSLAAEGWSYQEAATRPTTQHGVVADWETVNAGTPITDLRWRMLHPGGGPGEPNPDGLRRLRDLDAGVVPTDAGVNGGTSYPPYRRIYESGTHACLGSGAPDDAPYAPFVHLWYAVSGQSSVPNRGGVGADQRLSREQAVELATRRCDWFLGLDRRIGALEPGRLADLIVLSDDYYRVPVDRIRTLTSVLTMVGGRVVYREGP